MDSLHWIFLVSAIGFAILSAFLFFLLRKMDRSLARMEDFLVDLSQTMGFFKVKVDELFNQSIHYYDDTIFEFIDSTKKVKLEIDTIMNEYDDLKQFIVPEKTEEELKEELDQQPKEVLGLVKRQLR